jgi:tetratricopeptide (TPR) repeat protein
VVARQRWLTAALLAAIATGCAHDPATQGREALARGDDRQAVRQLELALRTDDHATLWRDLARAHQHAGDLEAAHAAIVEAAERAPEDPSIVLVRAQLRLARDDRDGAARDAGWLLDRLKDAGDLERLAVVFVRLGRADAAIAAGRRAVERSGGAADAYVNLAVLSVEMRRIDVAAGVLREGRARHPDHLALAESEAALLLARGDSSAARAAYLAMLPRHGRPGLVHLALALIEHELGDLDAALVHARAAVEAEGETRADVHYTLCVVLHDLGRDDEARAQLRRARRRFSAHDGLLALESTLGT